MPINVDILKVLFLTILYAQELGFFKYRQCFYIAFNQSISDEVEAAAVLRYSFGSGYTNDAAAVALRNNSSRIAILLQFILFMIFIFFQMIQDVVCKYSFTFDCGKHKPQVLAFYLQDLIIYKN
jgi:hypothetical protein